MLAFETERVLPGVLVRFVDVPPRRAMVVTAVDLGLWVCAAADVPEAAGWDAAVDTMRDAEGADAVGRCVAVFGLPWEDLTERILLAQLALMRDIEAGPMEYLRACSVEQLLALRQRVHGGRPASMVKALRCLHEYAELVQ